MATHEDSSRDDPRRDRPDDLPPEPDDSLLGRVRDLAGRARELARDFLHRGDAPVAVPAPTEPADVAPAASVRLPRGPILRDPEVTTWLTNHGYTSPLAIASESRTRFLAATADRLGDVAAAELHATADAQVAFLNSVLTGVRTQLAEGIADAYLGIPLPPPIPLPLPNLCLCDDCTNALSPRAYLTALLGYGVKHVVQAGSGMRAEYFDNIDFTDLKVTRAEGPIGSDAQPWPATGIAADNFSVLWTGYVEPEFSERYTFTTESDDGIRLWVNGRALVDHWDDHAPATDQGQIDLQVGKRYPVRTEYYQRAGGAVARLRWSSNSRPDEPVPNSRLWCDIGTPVDAAFLTDRLRQPLLALILTPCEVLEHHVRQVRICSEVLRSYLLVHPPTAPQQRDLDGRTREYLRRAYEALLHRAGTSYDEISSAPPASIQDPVEQRERAALAERLGISLGGTPDRLDALRLDRGTMTEADLEILFGLQDTTRDPISTGVKLGDDPIRPQLTRWQLRGVRWRESTSDDGRLYASLTFDVGIGVYVLALFRDAARQEVVASGNSFATRGLITLSGAGSSGVSGLAEIDYRQDTTAIELAVVPELLAWRLAHLRELWAAGDRTPDVPRAGVPVIDPDVIGPDDFRSPQSGGNRPGPYDLWLARRAWVDTWLGDFAGLTTMRRGTRVPDIGAMFAQMLVAARPYDNKSVPAWNGNTPATQFDALRDALASGTNVDVVRGQIDTDLNHPVEAFLRLLAFRDKDALNATDERAPELTAAEWRELFAILTLAEKRAYAAAWVAEEQRQGVTLDRAAFWPALREPEDGDWPPVTAGTEPLIDPELVQLVDLPESGVGADARALWTARRAAIGDIPGDLDAQRAQGGFDNMLGWAVGNRANNNQLPDDVDQLLQDLDGQNPATVQAAELAIVGDFYLTVEQFVRMMKIRAADAQPDPLKKPTVEDWAWLGRVLTDAAKRKQEYPVWRAEEQNLQLDTEYWRALKARLPLWLAAPGAREAWRQALAEWSRPPLVDPDLIDEADLRSPPADPVLARLAARRADLDARVQALATIVDLATLDVELTATFAADIPALADDWDRGENVLPRLDQLSLAPDAFARLVLLRRRLVRGGVLATDEWDEVRNILVQVVKQRDLFALWRREEAADGIVLGPDFFQVPEPAAGSPPGGSFVPTLRRGTLAARREWQDTLGARIDQEMAAITALSDAVAQTEESQLPRLRDALVDATDAPSGDLEQRARWMQDRLAIDTQDSGCRMTTRAAQAIESLQTLVNETRAGRYGGELALEDDAFDERWRWLGTYEAWRSATYIYLYPQNLLLPSLRSDQTPAFRALVSTLRSAGRVTPRLACEAARDYAAYFREICSLRVDAREDASTLIGGDECGPSSEVVRDLSYIFARSPFATGVYWTTTDKGDSSGQSQGSWDAVPKLADVVSVIGTAVYTPTERKRFLYLFASTQSDGVPSLVFTRYDLTTRRWDPEPKSLELPEPDAAFSAVLRRRTRNTEPPRLTLLVLTGDMFTRSLNDDGTDWEANGFVLGDAWRHFSPMQGHPMQADLSCADGGVRNTGKVLVVGDYDGDGVDEIAVAVDAESGGVQSGAKNEFWTMKYDPDTRRWHHMSRTFVGGRQADLRCSTTAAGDRRPTRHAVAGHFEGQGPAQLAVLPEADPAVPSTGNDIWVMKFDGGNSPAWGHFSPIAGHMIGADIDCTGLSLPANFLIAGHFEDTRRDSLLIAVAPGPVVFMGGAFTQSPDGRDFWARKYVGGASPWRDVGGIVNQATQANLRWQPPAGAQASVAASAALTVVGDFNGDQLDEVAIGDGNTGTFDVMQFANGKWQFMQPSSGSPGVSGGFTCHTFAWPAKFAVAGDFDGDGTDEIAVAFAGDRSSGNDLWVMKYMPLARTPGWRHFSPIYKHPVSADIDCSTLDFPAKFAVAGDFDGDGRDEIAVAPATDRTAGCGFWVLDYDPSTKSWHSQCPIPDDPLNADVRCSRRPYPARFAAAGKFDGTGRRELAVLPDAPGSRGNDLWVMEFDTTAVPTPAPAPASGLIRPSYAGPYEITDQRTDSDLDLLQWHERDAFEQNASAPRPIRVYLEEAWFFVPLQIAWQLQQAGEYEAALAWLRTVYDDTRAVDRKIYYGLVLDETVGGGGPRSLADPLNPHEIARTRPNAYTRYTLQAIAGCLLDFADAEFTRDTSESVARARSLYTRALDLFDQPELSAGGATCAAALSELRSPLGDPRWDRHWEALKRELVRVGDLNALRTTIRDVERAVATNGSPARRLARAAAVVRKALSASAPPVPVDVGRPDPALTRAHAALLQVPELASSATALADAAGRRFRSGVAAVARLPESRLAAERVVLPWLRNGASHAVPTGTRRARRAAPLQALHSVSRLDAGLDLVAGLQFCVPPNPIPNALRARAELELFLLRSCRNIAGLERRLEPYSAPTDATSGMPSLSARGDLVLTDTRSLAPTPYRYSALIERAKQLAQLAGQMESAMLAALEKRDAESYARLNARQNLESARAGVRVQELKVRVASDNVELATLQQEEAAIRAQQYSAWLAAGPTFYEKATLILEQVAARLSVGGGDAVSAITSGLRAIIEQNAVLTRTLASWERREQDWQFQLNLALQEERIGAERITAAQDELRVVEQERANAELQARHAQDVGEFLANKFTNAELYDWMAQVLQGVYRSFLQRAAATAQLARAQLAFERQEMPPAIQADYWDPSGDSLGLNTPGGAAPDRKGLTGSARLLADVYQLDQFAFERKQRLLQVGKTISLARLAPVEFEEFRRTGVLAVRTPMELFDRDFPGQYLRLVRRVRLSVIALVPPGEGIKASLATTGLSSVVVGDGFRRVTMRRAPESVALSSPRDATGTFDLDAQQSDLLFPFEGNGVDATWVLRMPKAANPFDYGTIADVLLSIEYTALDSEVYRQQVLQSLPTRIHVERPFSFRHDLVDPWFDLHNADQSSTPMTVRFETQRADFPPNVDDLRIEQVVLYFARSNGALFEVPVRSFRFRDASGGITGGGATTADGIISTRRSNGASWTPMLGKQPAGAWELTLRDDAPTRTLFEEGRIEDILLVVGITGETPAWSA
jgi:hypothetical protein